MTIWIFVLIYLLVGCVRTAYMLADAAIQSEGDLNVSAQEMGFSILFWGVNVVANVLANIFVMTYWFFRGDDE